MNRLGIVIDASHSSDATFDQLLALSKYPILLSHSSLRSAHDHPRNLDEGRLKALAAKGGAMCISTIYMSEMNMRSEEHTSELQSLMRISYAVFCLKKKKNQTQT